MNNLPNSTVSSLGSLTGDAGSSVLVLQDCSVRDTSLQQSDEANASCETQKMLGETRAVYGTSLLVAGDILVGRACPGVELESGEQEVIENLKGIIDEQSVMKGVSVEDPAGKELQWGNRDEVNVISNGVQDVYSVKEIQDKYGTFHTEDKASYDASGSDTSVKKLDSDNFEIHPNVKEAISSSPQSGRVTDDVSLAVIGNDGPQQMLLCPLEGPSVSNFRKKLLVLDVNGLLVDIVSHVSEGYNPDKIISGKAVFKRPFCDDFLQFCFERFHVGVWSSRTKKNLDSVLEFLMGKFKCNLLFCWDQSHCTDTGFNTIHNKDKPLVLKELKKLWEKQEPDLPWDKGEYNKSNTLLLDDSPYKALRNPPYTAIFPNPYWYKDVKDNSLGPGGTLRVYLEGLALADNVQKHVEMNPFGQQPITKTNSAWNFYLKVMNTSSSQPEVDANNSPVHQHLEGMNTCSSQPEVDANNSPVHQHLKVMKTCSSQPEVDMNTCSSQPEVDANSSPVHQHLTVMNTCSSQPEVDANSSPVHQHLTVMNTCSSQPEVNANNSSVHQQRLTPSKRGMGFDGGFPFKSHHDQCVGFDGRHEVVGMRKLPSVTMPLPPDASDTIYVEGLPPDSTSREVAHIFRPFVGYKEVRLVRKEPRHRGGYPFILCFVQFADPACAAAALSALDGYMVDQRDPYSSYLRLQFSRSGSGSRGKRQCRYYDR